MPRVQAAAREQPLWIFPNIIRDELIDAIGKADYLRRNVVDERRAVDAASVQMFQKCFRRATELGNLREVRPLLFHEFQRLGLKHLQRRELDVAVCDHSAKLTSV